MKTLISRCRHGIATSFVLLRHRTVVGVYRRSRFAGAIGPPGQRHCFYNNTQLGQHEVYSGGTFTAWRNTRCTAGKWGCCPRRHPLEPLLGSSWNRSLGLPWRSTGGGGKAPLGCCSSHVASLADSNAAHGLGLHLLLFRWAAVSRSSPSSPGPGWLLWLPPQRFRSAADSTVSVGLHSVTEHDLDMDFAGGLFYIVCGCPFYAVCKSRKSECSELSTTTTSRSYTEPLAVGRLVLAATDT